MQSFSQYKVITCIIICVIAILIALPNFLTSSLRSSLPSFLPQQQINLGLDLQGGSSLLLKVDYDSYIMEQYELLTDDLRKEFRSKSIGYRGLKPYNDKITIGFRNENDVVEAKKIIKSISRDLDIITDQDNFVLSFNKDSLKELKKKVIDQSIEIIRRRVDETGTKEPSIQRQGESYILLQVPGLENPDHLKKLLGKTAKLAFHLVDNINLSLDQARSKLSVDTMIIPSDKNEGDSSSFYTVKKKAIITGDMLTDARASFDSYNRPAVSFKFNNIGARLFGETTKANTGKLFAIILDNKVISAPMINEPILGGSGIITGNFSVAAANDLALLLRAGALPAPLEIIEERTVGPSLGNDSIEGGTKSFIYGGIFVTFFMAVTYLIFGIFANIALILNMIFIIAALTLFQATLTMPGIAGIILTMGMAVDANVLIFERIREELKAGKKNMNAIELGFKHAFSAIFDSNLTTIIAALCLFCFGSGPVKGFAVTLSIGILSSMFSAIVITKFMVYLYMQKNKNREILL